MSTEFKTLKECIEDKKGNFIGIIIKQGDLKSGTSNKGTKEEKDWTYKKFTISGQDGIEIVLTAWNGDIEKFKVQNKYEFTDFWFKEYEQQPVLDVGKFGKVNLIGTATLPAPPGQTTMPEPPTVQTHTTEGTPKEEESPWLKNQSAGHNGPLTPPKEPNLGELTGAALEFVQLDTIWLLQIEVEVKKIMKEYQQTSDDLNPAKVSMFVKEIYRKMQSVNFLRASKIE